MRSQRRIEKVPRPIIWIKTTDELPHYHDIQLDLDRDFFFVGLPWWLATWLRINEIVDKKKKDGADERAKLWCGKMCNYFISDASASKKKSVTFIRNY